MGKNITYKIKSGIYQWRSQDNGKIYVGSAVHISRRKNGHLVKLRQNKHENKNLQNTFNKYGEHRLEFSVLEFITDTSILFTREQYFIDTLNPEFNACRFAGGTRGLTAWNKGRSMPKNVIAKQQETKKSRIYERKIISDEHKKAIALKNTGRPKTAEQRRQSSERLKGRPSWNKGLKGCYESTQRKAVLKLSIDGTIISEYPSIAHAQQDMGKRGSISKCCKQGRICNGFKWKYKEAC